MVASGVVVPVGVAGMNFSSKPLGFMLFLVFLALYPLLVAGFELAIVLCASQ